MAVDLVIVSRDVEVIRGLQNYLETEGEGFTSLTISEPDPDTGSSDPGYWGLFVDGSSKEVAAEIWEEWGFRLKFAIEVDGVPIYTNLGE